MQMGALMPAKASIAAGIPDKDSPQMRPDATAGPKSLACCLFFHRQTNRIKLPTHMSMAKYPPSAAYEGAGDLAEEHGERRSEGHIPRLEILHQIRRGGNDAHHHPASGQACKNPAVVLADPRAENQDRDFSVVGSQGPVGEAAAVGVAEGEDGSYGRREDEGHGDYCHGREGDVSSHCHGVGDGVLHEVMGSSLFVHVLKLGTFTAFVNGVVDGEKRCRVVLFRAPALHET
nr:hypothetical protein POPTR_017G150300 [Ipomoea batatas]